MKHKILIVDDVRTDAEATAEILNQLANVYCTVVTSSDRALDLIARSPRKFSLLVADFNMPDMDGLALANAVWKLNPKQLISILSGDENPRNAIKCVGTPIVEFIQKGVSATVLHKRVQNLLHKFSATHETFDVSSTQNENETLIADLGLVGKSESMAGLARKIKKVSPSGATVLILGESGTGKERIAQAIHKMSSRSQGPFVAINVGAINVNLIESELFGHERGSFTGATQKRIGAFESARGGTIFLDEVGELRVDLQVKLLRVLQEKEMLSVGSSQTVKTDCRVIAATNNDLRARAEAGEFRRDLFHRLDVISLTVPPLRERKDDIAPLARHFLLKIQSDKTILLSAFKHLEAYSWPGNVRELEHLIEKLHVLIDDAEIHPEHLPSEIFQKSPESSDPEIDFNKNYQDFCTFLSDLERTYLLFHLGKAKSTRDAAINRMEVALSTLRDKMRIHNLTFSSKEENHEEAI